VNRLYERLAQLKQSDIYPFHMPGHKRNMKGRKNEKLYDIDITEIDGFDNLHHAEGILKELKDRAGAIYGGYKTWISVNGSTAGILSAISASCKQGDTIILDRGSHKSAYNACAIRKLNTVFVYPKMSYRESPVRGGIDPKEIEDLLDRHCPKAVFVTSPSYDGVVSDIEAIANICHAYGIPLIVDEAHGAHFFLDDRFPKDALRQGADVVIHSIHKTLPAPTQTALVHMQGELVEVHALDAYMGLYQTSSPSYVLMAAIEQCLDIIEEEGDKLSDVYFENIENFFEKNRKLKNISILDYDSFRDRSKIIIYPQKSCRKKISGADIGNLLRNRYHIEPEMIVPDYVCALSSLMDSREGFDRLADALGEIDSLIDAMEEKFHEMSDTDFDGMMAETNDFFVKKNNQGGGLVMDMDAPKERRSLEESVGYKSGGFVQLYPPGIPLLIPGEAISDRQIDLIRKYKQYNLLVEGVDGDKIWILK